MNNTSKVYTPIIVKDPPPPVYRPPVDLKVGPKPPPHDVVDELNQDISFKKTYLGGRIQKSAFKTELASKRIDAIIKHLEL